MRNAPILARLMLPRLVLAGLVATLAAPGWSQTRRAEATIRVESTVGVSEISRMVFSGSGTAEPTTVDAVQASRQTRLVERSGQPANAPAVIRVSGDPGRVYRINLPRTIQDPQTNTTISGFSVWSENSGDITETLSARMDEHGSDTLQVTGFRSSVAFSDVTAAVPIAVNYE